MPREADTQDTLTQEIRDLFKHPISHFADRNARWLFKEKENVRGLVEIVASELVDYLDFEKLVELNRSFITGTLRELESDIVFSVPFKTGEDTEELLIYILLEHQSTVDPLMAFRLLFYMCQIWDEQRRDLESAKVPRSEWWLRPILPIVYYTGSQKWHTPLSLTTSMEMPTILERFVPSFETLFLGVKDTDTADLTKTDHPLGWLLTVLQQEHADKNVMLDALQRALSHIQQLEPIDAAQYRNAILYLCHLIFFRRPENERHDLLELVNTYTHNEEVRNMVLTSAEVLIEQGKVEGIEQGKVEGIEQGKVEGKVEGEIRAKQDSILTLLRLQFPDVSDAVVIKQITEINDLSRLDTLFEQVYNAATLDDVDLETQR